MNIVVCGDWTRRDYESPVFFINAQVQMTESRFPFTSYPKGWFRVGWSKDLPPGGVRPIFYFGRDLVLFRTESGRACVLDAHCPHLGAHLGHGGKIFGENIRCPFHGWRLNTKGRCVEIPYCEKIPPKARTRAWAITENNGVIFVYHDSSGHPPDWSIPDLEEASTPGWSEFRPGARWRIRTHLQELGENGMDKAHFSFLHPQQTKRMRSESTEAHGPVFVHRTFQNYQVFGFARMFVDEVSGPLDLTLYGLGMAVNRTCVDAKIKLYYTFVFFFTPIDDEHTEVSCMLSMKKIGGPLVTGLLLQKAIREGQRTIDQDVPIWENKVYREKPALCREDGPIMIYRNWARQFYGGTNPRDPDRPEDGADDE